MSELFEAIIIATDAQTAHSAFDSLSTPLNLNLVRLSDELYSAYRVALRDELFDENAINDIAAQMSATCKQSLVVYYDNSCGINCAVLFSNKIQDRFFGENDEIWVLLNDRGDPLIDGKRYRIDQLDNDEKYECI